MERTRNLPHIASLALNEPLLLEPAYARVFFCALGHELGIGKLIDGPGNTVLSGGQMQAVASAYADGRSSINDCGYDIQSRIAVVPVSGTLVSKTGSLRPYSGMTGYNGIVSRLQAAITDPAVDGILLDMDTPGGMVAGGFDAADMIARLREKKPIWALANDMNCSAGQLLASACSRRLVTQTAKTGSIGVLMAHSNYAGSLAQEGVDITLIFSGAHKVDGNPYGALPDAVRASLQAQIDTLRQAFAVKVSEYTGMTVADVLGTEAAVYTGLESVEVGLSDEVVLNTDAVGVMREALDGKRTFIYPGDRMNMNTKETEPQVIQTATSTAPVETKELNVKPSMTEAEETVLKPLASDNAQADVVASAVAGEQARIMGILDCAEASGREVTARALAATPGMTVEHAQRILASTPQSAQVRTDTALDRMMAQSPETVSAGAQADADTDLMNIPV